MRVLVVHNRYRSGAPSGENRVVDQERNALLAAGHTVEQFERYSDDIEGWSLPARVLLPARVVWSDESRRSLSQVLHRSRPDVVHIHNTFPLISPSVLHACVRQRVPAVISIHNYRLLCAADTGLFRDGRVCHDCVARRVPIPALVHRCYRHSAAATAPVVMSTLVNRATWRTKGSAYVFVSESQRATFKDLALPPDRTFVKANLIPRIPPMAAPTVREPLVAYIGRLDEAKGILFLMEAWDRFQAGATGAPLRLTIAGGGPLEARVAQWAASRPAVSVLGIVSAQECSEIMARARAVILPSQCEETFGLVVVEAMAAGAPPVAAGHGPFPELITDGTDGVLFDPRNAASLATILVDIEANPARYERYGKAARETYGGRFDPGENLKRLIDIYHFAIDNPVFVARAGAPSG